MAGKRDYTLLLRKQGNKNHKLELFNAKLWENKEHILPAYGLITDTCYRDGVWYNYNDRYRYTFMTHTEIRNLTLKSFFIK